MILSIPIILFLLWSFIKPSIVNVNNSNNNNPINNPVNCYDEQVPYEETERYIETVPYQEEIPLKFSSNEMSSESCSDFGNYKKCYYINVNNLDTTGGTFKVDCKFETLNRNLYDSQTLFIQAGETKKFTCIADTDLGEDVKGSYIVTPSTKTETKYRDVERTKKIVKYRTEKVCN